MKILKSFIFLLILTCSSLFAEPEAIYLTWRNSPQTTMIVQWITLESQSQNAKSTNLKYKAFNETVWKSAQGNANPVKGFENYLIHRIEVTNLRANTIYSFKPNGSTLEYKFKTLPAQLDSSFLRFICAGDVYSSSLLEVGDKFELANRMHKTAASQNPSFVFLGGDLAYSGDYLPLWIEWLQIWQKNMVTSEGVMIPMLTAVGNHDFAEDVSERSFPSTTYAQLFPTASGKSYYSVDINPSISFFSLDSNIVSNVTGTQSTWLESSLKSRKNVPYKFAIYHVPAYPSYRDEENRDSTVVRDNFCPLFDKYGVTVAFENHDHTYKRTKLILDDKEDPSGVLYVGDGAMGVNPDRNPMDDGIPWYLLKWAQKRHCIVVDVNNTSGKIRAIDEFGNTIDQTTFKPRAKTKPKDTKDKEKDKDKNKDKGDNKK